MSEGELTTDALHLNSKKHLDWLIALEVSILCGLVTILELGPQFALEAPFRVRLQYVSNLDGPLLRTTDCYASRNSPSSCNLADYEPMPLPSLPFTVAYQEAASDVRYSPPA
jgi:hypothetical protein